MMLKLVQVTENKHTIETKYLLHSDSLACLVDKAKAIISKAKTESKSMLFSYNDMGDAYDLLKFRSCPHLPIGHINKRILMICSEASEFY